MSDQSSCFCDDPAEARERFLAECLKAGLAPMTLPAHAAAEGMYCDIARLGAPSAHSTIVLCSAAAGRSGLAHAGICTGLLQNRLQRHLESQVSIVLVHAVNPEGAVWPRPPADEPPLTVDGDSIQKAESSWTRELLTAVDRRFGTELGQTMDVPEHLSGAEKPTESLDTLPVRAEDSPAWTRADLHRIAEVFLSEAQFVLSLDIRTGLGQWGVPSLRNADPGASAARGRARRWFGPLEDEASPTSFKAPDFRSADFRAQKLGAVEFGSENAGSGGLAAMAEDAETVSMIVDFGTFPGTGLVSTVSGRQQTRQDYPSQRDWREKVYAQAEAIVLRSIQACEEMADAGRRLKSAEQDDF